MKGWVDLGYPAILRPGVKLAICQLLVQRPLTTNHRKMLDHCLARHLCTWLTTYIWSRKGLDAGSARLPTDRVLFHAHTTHSVTEVSLSWTASQQTYATGTSPTRASGVNLKRTGSLAAGAQCVILLNCAIQIPLLNWTEPSLNDSQEKMCVIIIYKYEIYI